MLVLVFFLCELIRLILTVLSEIKNGDPINFEQISAGVTSLGPSSNFLEDLSTILECQINIGGIIEK